AELGRQRALEHDAIAPHRFERLLGERRALLCHRRNADLLDVPFDLDPSRFDGSPRGLDDLRARAVTREQRDAVSQCGVLPLCASTTAASYFATWWTLRLAEAVGAHQS